MGVAQDQVTWVRDPTAFEPPGRTGTRIPCGSYGVFHFEIDGAPSPGLGLVTIPVHNPIELCLNQHPDCESGQEVPPRYAAISVTHAPPVQQAPAPIPIGNTSASLGGKRGSAGSPRAGAPLSGLLKDAWTPCATGSCFDSKGVPTGARPWVAVIDWDDAHGWSVGWTVRELVGPGHDVALLNFLTPDLQEFSAKGVTDVHTLVKLCEISDAVDRGLRRPSAINMSFGRYFRPGVDSDLGSPCQSDDFLSCQIVRVLEHLYSAPAGPGTGTVLVAAAGNYRTLQFPAAVQTVIPAGGLDLDGFESQRLALGTWETAPELASGLTRSRALLPASGVCLEASPGTPGSPSWAAPPGTSYSSAILAGWLALELAAGTVADPLLPDLWNLQRTCSVPGSCNYRLQQGSQRVYGSHPTTDLFCNRLFDPANRDCGVDPPQVAGIVDGSVTYNLLPDPTLLIPSFLQTLAGWELPSPDSNPCIPCAGARQPPPKSLGVNALKAVPLQPTGPVIIVDAVPLDWWIDFTESGAFVDGSALDSIYLRTGTEFRKVSVPAASLELMRTGKLDGLYLHGAGTYLTGTRQASLIFILHRTGTPLIEQFWTSIPVYFP